MATAPEEPLDAIRHLGDLRLGAIVLVFHDAKFVRRPPRSILGRLPRPLSAASTIPAVAIGKAVAAVEVSRAVLGDWLDLTRRVGAQLGARYSPRRLKPLLLQHILGCLEVVEGR